MRIKTNKNRFKIAAIILGLFSFSNNLPANYLENLPDIGTAGASTLSIAQEIEMGDFYTRKLQNYYAVIGDPVLSNYINQLGNKLAIASQFHQMPFHFSLINNAEINAFALFGGNIVVYSGLFNETDNENELASVIAHEVAHISQRHLARTLESRKISNPMTIAALMGSIFVTFINPTAGVAAISGTIAGAQQSAITYTQSYEQEADQVGFSILTRANFDPNATVTFMQKLADKERAASKPPEILLTHPLSTSRISSARNKLINSNSSTKKFESSLDYYLAKIRVANYIKNKNRLQNLTNEYNKSNNPNQKIAAKYGQALQKFDEKSFNEAKKLSNELLQIDPKNTWFIDIATDIDINSNNKTEAISRLNQAIKNDPNSSILQINLANVLIENKNNQEAISLLHRYVFEHPNDFNGWTLLEKAYHNSQKNPERLWAKAEIEALKGNFDQSIKLLSQASANSASNPYNRSKFDSRIEQINELKKRLSVYGK